ncbi:SH3 beta-barrel fold-containing protein [Bacteroides ihuae]|uniref:SH3 beta-barrel fold-containing protein n=1 Tax=Bacteroides ihuae TaxID=1852362 RepID=UPI0008D9DD7D|nr:SH3 beta-barrel fold-containing protein [Bacteroides ihuae]
MRKGEDFHYQQVMFRAACIRKEKMVTMEEAIQLAEKIEVLFTCMLSGEAEFSYMRQDGGVEETRGTLTNYQKVFKRPCVSYPENVFMLYYDLKAERWRTFHVAFLL